MDMPVIIKKEGDPLDPKHPLARGALIIFGGKRPAILPRPSTAKPAEDQAPNQEAMVADKAKPEEKAGKSQETNAQTSVSLIEERQKK